MLSQASAGLGHCLVLVFTTYSHIVDKQGECYRMISLSYRYIFAYYLRRRSKTYHINISNSRRSALCDRQRSRCLIGVVSEFCQISRPDATWVSLGSASWMKLKWIFLGSSRQIIMRYLASTYTCSIYNSTAPTGKFNEPLVTSNDPFRHYSYHWQSPHPVYAAQPNIVLAGTPLFP